ncbi:hypothetical protein PV729_38290 [Streptomyces europaeiscabiei]|uniref:Integral membrane protein n=1 Tax=Streptomyces europaeiscabiei TaxID=146819 RepID=A0ABU4NN03_9ACTN|nr:hypothetical protein [Streptomyces europaeiscabiei]MDX3546188.1 hypothetical protein [Streptomyces europaeiscabiei]MDX3557506.1 hypothetical protein [Streptomyces europaeiscabiei]MDX3703587.1 hypothetical protein [Streptomyces europaeiscabiei]
MITAVSEGHDPTHQLQTSLLTLFFGIALIGVGRILRRTGQLPAYLDFRHKALDSLVTQEGRSSGVVRLGTGLIAVGGFFLLSTVRLLLGALGILGAWRSGPRELPRRRPRRVSTYVTPPTDNGAHLRARTTVASGNPDSTATPDHMTWSGSVHVWWVWDVNPRPRRRDDVLKIGGGFTRRTRPSLDGGPEPGQTSLIRQAIMPVAPGFP